MENAKLGAFHPAMLVEVSWGVNMSKESQIDVPDSIQPFLNEIASRIWSDRAAVMVGAGFSKNADPGFPDWNQLGDLFYQLTHGEKPEPAKQKYLNVLRLAEEVQATVGRPALENLLRSNIPDLTIDPSELHVQLLELPWADVFTTNYDTLLERASAKVLTRRYEPVVNAEDIPYACRPRIVKLHGSFPSTRPFVITEEDYRRYPHDNAPFVNTVQQSLLENTLCLIGFSGDDPNFLQWIGWIRDNLGEGKTQKIYLIGAFDLSVSKLQLLAQRGIVLVDMSCCAGIEKQDHKRALRKFFEFMRSKKPEELDWPYTPQTLFPAQGADRIEEIKKISEEWQKQRQTYPGWLILPYGNRDTLWTYTQVWLNYLPDTDQSPPGLDIRYAFELIWRLERCLLPVLSDVSDFCERVLEKYWPFHTGDPSKNCMFRFSDEKLHGLPWNDIRQAWVALALAVLRFYREEWYLDKWREAEIQIETVSEHLSAEQKEFFNYEGVLFSLFSLDLPNVKERLAHWQPNESQPYWRAKRAAVLAEIGLLNEAESLSRNALDSIRKKNKQKIGVSNITLFSQESNAMLLGKYIQNAASLQKNDWGEFQEKKRELKDRWNELKGYKCDPWNELQVFESILSNPPVERKNTTEKQEFDIGRITRTHYFGGVDQELFNAYSFLRFCEEVGLPFRVGNYTLAIKTAAGSLQRISRYSFFWAAATLVRLGDAKVVDNLFSRESVYKFAADEADRLVQNYLDALDKCRDDIRSGDAFKNNNYGVRLAHILPEVISRLCCRCSNEMKARLLGFVTAIYGSPEKRNYRNVGNLVRRLISSMSQTERYALIPDLLKIPFPEGLNFSLKDEFLNPFLVREFNKKLECSVPALAIQPRLIDELLQHAALDNPDRRRWSISSLATLYTLQLLDAEQNRKFAVAIWRKTDQYGLPSETDFHKFAFLRLPHPETSNPSELFKNYVATDQFPIHKTEREAGIGITGGNIPLVFEILGANGNGEGFWTAEDAIGILKRLLTWWDADKDKLNEKEREPAWVVSIPEEFQARFACIVELLAEVVGPKLSYDSPDDIKSDLGRLLKEMRERNLQTLRAEAACLHLYPEQEVDIYDRINESLISNREKAEEDGLEAIAKIILRDTETESSAVEHDPIFMLSQYLTWRSTHSITKAMSIVIRILKNKPANFSTSLEVGALNQLNRLLSEAAYSTANSTLLFNEKVEIRRVAAFLAATLWKYYISDGSPVPSVIEKWRDVCLSPEEFAEIRNAWVDCEEN